MTHRLGEVGEIDGREKGDLLALKLNKCCVVFLQCANNDFSTGMLTTGYRIANYWILEC